MAPTKDRDPELVAVVERARARFAAGGALRPPRIAGFRSAFSVEAQEIVRDWRDDGGYARALELIAQQDPDLANQ